MMLTEEYRQARILAVEIAQTFDAPRFYVDLRRERVTSSRMLHTDAVIEKLRQIVISKDEHFGHGLKHSEKVAMDAGAIVQNEWSRVGRQPDQAMRAVFLVQLAALLHDVRRRVPNHARQSARAASEILTDFPLEDMERNWIVRAIENHEAFVESAPMECPEGQLLSDALYDADKFRWGPDNFTDTIWEMIAPTDLPLKVLMAHFPKGMEGVKRIATTFRSQTGMRYGPEFIEIGLAIGNKLYDELLKRLAREEEQV
ncbi:MAG: hypothetical protein C4532_14660 [Candidatus Abyssobacteria bacterium SURF_17]|uniref:HD domain-containing protein n=1 Tax=Candidatus Abyssobacteria bacterium SURF_17 TaxID=2093361 RepID=A0A419ETV5_9BACT|nr:MAG: hypothetical protein C4532_14660 [Candidatus Abyssubacteria bacterium SURF_17]